jgi:hypothetical protein
MPLDAAPLLILCGIVLAFLAFTGTLMWSDFQSSAAKK